MTQLRGTEQVFDKTEKSKEDFFVKMPYDLMHYVHLPGYKPQFNYPYTILVDFYNADYGYAFPTEHQIARKYGVKSVKTVRKHLRFLEDVGLIKIAKPNGNKIYVPYKPLSQEELFRQCPQAAERYREFIAEEDAEKRRGGRV
ncbi:helix-turn-helix domain-containing protein [Piscibacillus sp. B03]|uniref:helix-turn-helix domain-containing protein n=1 Tax=Piscibacillus sp. B03 TaxID=3457430 RepID=UPI003FCDB90E